MVMWAHYHKWRGILVTENTERSKLLNVFFVLVFTDKTSPQRSLTQEHRVKECWKEDLSLNSEKEGEGSGASLLQVQAEGAGAIQS